MFSILIPTLNNADLLNMSLNCIEYTQREKNQIVIYDNDSRDDTMDVVKRWMNYLDIDYRRGPNIGQYYALDDCYSRAKYDYCFRIHTDMCLCVAGWEKHFEAAIRKVAHPWKWLMCARSIEPIQGHTKFHIIRDYSFGQDCGQPIISHLFDDFEFYNDRTIITGYREPFLMHKKLYEQFDINAMLEYKAYGGDDHTVMAAYHAGVRRFWMVNGVLVYHMVGPKGGQTNTSKDSQDKDQSWPYEFYINYWKKMGYNNVEHPARHLPKLIPEYINV